MMQGLTARAVRAYKGAAASILLLFLVEGRPLSQGEMRRGSGYQDEAINDAVLMLREDGLIVETGRYTWALLEGARQLPIGAVDALPEGEVDGGELGPDDPELALNESMNQGYTESIGDDSLIDGELGPEKPELRADRRGADLPSELATAAGLQGLGFYGRGIADMARIQGLTMAEVRWQVEHSPNLGCALARIKKRQAWGERVRDGPTERSAYVSGEFADFIQH